MTTTGIGYDVHRFAVGRRLVLGGVEFDHPMGLDGHSDADVLSHAIADALLGAAGEADIGHHFPNSDERLRGISSVEILRHVRELLAGQSIAIVNIDATVIAEAPKIGPRIVEMKRSLGEALGVGDDRVGIKATTNEGLGFLGRGEGIAAMAVALVERKEWR